jgi:hypothetical protein
MQQLTAASKLPTMSDRVMMFSELSSVRSNLMVALVVGMGIRGALAVEAAEVSDPVSAGGRLAAIWANGSSEPDGWPSAANGS